MAHDYLTVADVLGMHTALMQRYGGAPGVRDPGALEAALFRPQTGYYDDIVAEAAANVRIESDRHFVHFSTHLPIRKNFEDHLDLVNISATPSTSATPPPTPLKTATRTAPTWQNSSPAGP